MDFGQPFGDWLKERRQSLRLTQEELAQQVGYSAISLRKIEAGAMRPSREAADKLADLLSIPTGERAAFIAFARGVGTSQHQTNLPVPPTPLIGRENDIAAASGMLARDDVRLLTLVGPPGVGKTRLAVAIANRLAATFADDACFVPLSSITDPDQVNSAIAAGLNLRPADGECSADRLQRHLRGKSLLLVLDNFEHLLPAARDVADLLSATPGLKVLVTSRTILRLSAEHEYEVRPLDVPNLGHLPSLDRLARIASVDLFTRRAQAIKPGFTLTQANAPDVSAICHHLDGLPLSIELAAARSRLLTPRGILERLDHHIGAAMRLLSDGARDLPVRQRTLRATIEWSYNLLSPAEQRLLRRLAVFVGGWTLEAAEDVCQVEASPGVESRADIANLLQSLVDQSLVQQSDNAFGETWFSFLEMIREYALEQIEINGEIDAARKRHAEYYARFSVPNPGPESMGLEHAYFTRYAAESGNCLAALEWSRSPDGDPCLTVALASGLAWYQFFSSRYHGMRGQLDELRACIEDNLARCPDTPVKLMLKARHSLGLIAHAQGNIARAVQMGKHMLALAQQHNLVIPQYWASNMVGSYALRAGDFAEAEQCFERAQTLARQTGSRTQAAYAMTCLGYVAFERGDLQAAAARQEQALALWRGTGIQWAMDGAISGAALALGLTALFLGDYVRSVALEAEAVGLFTEAGDKGRAARALLFQGRALQAMEELDAAAECWRDSLALCHDQEVDNAFWIAIILAELAGLAQQQGDALRFMRLAGAAARGEAPATRESYVLFLRRDYDLILASARNRLADPALAAAWAEGQAMTVDQAVDYAIGD